MKPKIHPEYKMTSFRCACGSTWNVLSSKVGESTVEICSNCHPFFTGGGKFVIDTAGRIEKFEEKVAKDFDLNEEWESARARFSEVFPIRRTLEQLKAKREETNGE